MYELPPKETKGIGRVSDKIRKKCVKNCRQIKTKGL